MNDVWPEVTAEGRWFRDADSSIAKCGDMTLCVVDRGGWVGEIRVANRVIFELEERTLSRGAAEHAVMLEAEHRVTSARVALAALLAAP